MEQDMIPHFWGLVIGMPIAALVLAMASLGIFGVSDRLYGLGSLRPSRDPCDA